ncbi:hypothetical protein AVEN_265473-1 [Araneus ventricosus]|uniref:Uncharacterized protein n=1 Tax=Araneus ventricosus TaxID=182803 RepID=A0A4Y2CGF1_ARAVE|nr:hypothetical protein AVEN_265473-1 [Araneus ventricosus]
MIKPNPITIGVTPVADPPPNASSQRIFDPTPGKKRRAKSYLRAFRECPVQQHVPVIPSVWVGRGSFRTYSHSGWSNFSIFYFPPSSQTSSESDEEYKAVIYLV